MSQVRDIIMAEDRLKDFPGSFGYQGDFTYTVGSRFLHVYLTVAYERTDMKFPDEPLPADMQLGRSGQEEFDRLMLWLRTIQPGF